MSFLASVGYDRKSIYDENRKLVFENPQTGVRVTRSCRVDV